MVIEENPLVFSHDGTCCVLQVEPVHTQIHLLSSIRPPNNNNHVGISGRKPSDRQWVSDQAAWGRGGGGEGGKNLTGDLVF